MTTHSKAFPALPAPADPHAAAAEAPAIETGSPYGGRLVGSALDDYQRRRQLRALGLATNDDVLTARLRWRALETEYASAAYPPGPRRAARPTEMVQGIASIRENMDERWDDTDGIRHTVAVATTHRGPEAPRKAGGAVSVSARMTRAERLQVSTALRNGELREQNRRSVYWAYANKTKGDIPLVQFLQVSPQAGPGILPHQEHMCGLPVVAVGAPIPSPPFPTTFAAIRRMTRQGINDLAIVMNNTFGIRATDPRDIWQQQVRLALTGYLW